jgi:hypothetical protein
VDENKRQQRRYDCRIDLEVVVGADTHAAVIHNISLGGVYIVAVERPAFGSRVTLRFKVPTQKDTIEVGGTVRWADVSGFGVQFDGLRARDVWALNKYFEKLG